MRQMLVLLTADLTDDDKLARARKLLEEAIARSQEARAAGPAGKSPPGAGR